MQVDYIRREVPTAISEDGGAYIQLVNKNTVGLSDSIKEAVDNLYINGQPTTVKAYFEGLFKSMLAGIRADGHPRKLGGLITVYPVCKGEIDLDNGWDPTVNSVRIYARLLNEIDIDVTNWSLRDVTPGKVSFSLESVAGPTMGIATRGTAVDLNGKNFPAQSNLRVNVSCNGKSFDVPATAYGSTVTRITLNANALSSLTSADNGKDITFTVRGCYNTAKITGTFVYADIVIAQTSDGKCVVNSVKDDGSETTFNLADEWIFGGKGFYQSEATAPEGEWWKDEIGATIGGKYVSFNISEVGSDNKTMKITAETSGTMPAAGTYENITLSLGLINHNGQTATLSIPLAQVVVA